MVPSSLLGLVLFVALLAPGFAYVLLRERTTPRGVFSPFRESLTVVFASVACLAAVALLHTGLRALLPDHTLNVRELVRDPASYAREHHVSVAWWSFALLVGAVGIGVAAAHPRVLDISKRLGFSRVLGSMTGSNGGSIDTRSAWHKVMHMYDEEGAGPIFVGASMDDGSYVQGRLYSFSPVPEETQDREILLSAPISLTSKEGLTGRVDAQFSVISARRIVRLDVKHFEQGEDVDEAWVGPESKGGDNVRWWWQFKA